MPIHAEQAESVGSVPDRLANFEWQAAPARRLNQRGYHWYLIYAKAASENVSVRIAQ